MSVDYTQLSLAEIRVQRRFVAPPLARPAASDIAPDVIDHFVVQHRQAAEVIATVDQTRAARAVMTSPFVRLIMYSVLDGWRPMVAHDRRHLGQAQRVVATPGFRSAATAR